MAPPFDFAAELKEIAEDIFATPEWQNSFLEQAWDDWYDKQESDRPATKNGERLQKAMRCVTPHWIDKGDEDPRFWRILSPKRGQVAPVADIISNWFLDRLKAVRDENFVTIRRDEPIAVQWAQGKVTMSVIWKELISDMADLEAIRMEVKVQWSHHGLLRPYKTKLRHTFEMIAHGTEGRPDRSTSEGMGKGTGKLTYDMGSHCSTSQRNEGQHSLASTHSNDARSLLASFRDDATSLWSKRSSAVSSIRSGFGRAKSRVSSFLQFR